MWSQNCGIRILSSGPHSRIKNDQLMSLFSLIKYGTETRKKAEIVCLSETFSRPESLLKSSLRSVLGPRSFGSFTIIK